MKLKKQFGQHFLIDQGICKDIIQALRQKSDINLPLLEIGPGAGALTQYLVQEKLSAYKVVEIDEEKIQIIRSNFGGSIDEILHGDFLKMEIPFSTSFNIIGNFPYNISSQIMFKIVEWREIVPSVIGMFQKEVARRIASKEGNKDYGILSVILQAYYDIEYLFDVRPEAFNPPPKVMSGVISLQSNHDLHQIRYPGKFLKLVKAAFATRRKTLRNNWKGMIQEVDWSRPTFDQRAEQLSVQDFVNLYKEFYE